MGLHGLLQGDKCRKLNLKNVGFGVLTAVVIISTIFGDITECFPLKVNRRFGKNISPPPSASNTPGKIPARKQAATISTDYAMLYPRASES
jgi:hypothetical protein